MQTTLPNRYETRVDSNEGSSLEEKIVSYVLEHLYCCDCLRELENLWKQVNDLEIELRGQN